MTLARSLLMALKNYGATQIFGLPGDFILPFFKASEELDILPIYTFSHEPAVGFAADAAARAQSGLGVAAVTYGAGALNMVNSVACAYTEKSPLVIISGAPGVGESKSGLLLHHQVKTLNSQMAIYKEITCAQLVLDDMEAAPQKIAEILQTCLAQSRPVYIELPRNMVNEACSDVPYLAPIRANKDALRECALSVLASLKSADRPVIMAGVEVRRYGLEGKLAEFSKKTNIPLVTSFMGRGLFASSDCPFLGTYLGLAGEEDVMDYVENSDGTLFMGVILSDTNFGISQKHLNMRNVIDVSDGLVKFGHHQYSDIPLIELMDALLKYAEELNLVNENLPEIICPEYSTNMDASDEDVVPDDISCAINDLFNEHGSMPMISDVGDCLFTAMGIKHTQLIASAYYATMGMAVPAGMGLEIALGQRPIILVGDGAFQMTGWEMGHCKRYGLKPIIVVFNNSGWEMLRTFQPEGQHHDLGTWKFAEIADVMGGVGHKVHSKKELFDSLNNAVADDTQFHVVEVMLKQGEISSTLRKYAKSISRISAVKAPLKKAA